MQKYLILLLVVGVLCNVVFGKDKGNKRTSSGGDSKADGESNVNGESNDDTSSDDSSIEDEEDPDYVFHGNLVAMAFRDVDRKVEFETTVSGRPFLDRSTIKKLRKRHELQAYVNGFAVLTEKRDTCSGKHEVKADLIFSSIDRKEFRMVFQGQIFLESDVLCAIGGDGLVMVEGQATLSFTPDGPSRRKRTVNEFTVKFSSGIIFVIK